MLPAMRKRPGEVRDAIVSILRARPQGASVADITRQVTALIGDVPSSSVRSYLQLNTPQLFARMNRAQYVLNGFGYQPEEIGEKTASRSATLGKATLVQDDCLAWLSRQPANTMHAIVTDPPYGLVEYSDLEQKNFGQVRAVFGECHLHSTVRCGHLYLVSRYLNRPTLTHLNNFLRSGRRGRFRYWCREQMSLWRATHSCLT